MKIRADPRGGLIFLDPMPRKKKRDTLSFMDPKLFKRVMGFGSKLDSMKTGAYSMKEKWMMIAISYLNSALWQLALRSEKEVQEALLKIDTETQQGIQTFMNSMYDKYVLNK
jgi:gas vesicle protein